MNYSVLVYEGDYPEGEGSSCTLLGIYYTREDARFISETDKKREKRTFFPRIVETAQSVTEGADGVRAYRKALEEKKADENKS